MPARPGQDDFERALDAYGQQQLQECAARFVATHGVGAVDSCLHSAAVRTTATARAFTQALALPTSAVHAERGLYEVSPSELLEYLRTTANTVHHLLVVGHNPTLSSIAWQLAPEVAPDGLLPCDHVTIEVSGPWANLGLR
jgi:phosphohistidine phosphatase